MSRRGGRFWPSSVERNYHLMFRRIHPKTLEAIRDVVRRGLWRVPEDEGFELLRELYRRLSEVYGLPTPKLRKATYEHYFVPTETIGLPKVSLVSALHEYRHHMQKYGKQHYSDPEIDARGWSISAFRLALPEAFERAWRGGRIWFMPPYPEGGAEEEVFIETLS